MSYMPQAKQEKKSKKMIDRTFVMLIVSFIGAVVLGAVAFSVKREKSECKKSVPIHVINVDDFGNILRFEDEEKGVTCYYHNGSMSCTKTSKQ